MSETPNAPVAPSHPTVSRNAKPTRHVAIMASRPDPDHFETLEPQEAERRQLLVNVASLALGLANIAGCGGGKSMDDSLVVSPGESELPPVSTPALEPAPAPVSPSASHASPVQPPAPAPGEPFPRWASALPLWHWAELPGTALASVEPAARPLGANGPRSKIETWCGACLRREGSVYMLGAAGGHGDYVGNEVNALTLYDEAPRWVELRPPTPNSDVINLTQFYLDGRPAATHTYFATQHIRRLDRMLVMSSAGLNGDSFAAAPVGFRYSGQQRSFSFNYVARDWDSPDYVAAFPGSGDYTACLCVRHPLTDDVYYSRNYGDGWYRWTAADNRWDKLSNRTRNPWYAGSAIDSRRDRILVVGGYSISQPELLDLNGQRINLQFKGLGVSALLVGGYPAVVYDEFNDIFIVAYNYGASINVLTVAANDLTVSNPVVTGVIPTARKNGLQNSLQYVPELGGVVIANNYYGNVLFMRTSR